MPASSAYQAYVEFTRDIQSALNCFSPIVFDRVGGYHRRAVPHRISFPRGEPVPLRGKHELALNFAHAYRLEPGGSGWSVRSAAYYYTLLTRAGRELFVYHWHPETTPDVAFPHLHIEPRVDLLPAQFAKAHFPTGRTSFEDFLEFAVGAFDVTPLRADWRRVLHRGRARLEAERTW